MLLRFLEMLAVGIGSFLLILGLFVAVGIWIGSKFPEDFNG